MEQNLSAVGAPVEPSVRPRAWADDNVMAGQVGNCASDAAKTYWERSDQFDRMMAERMKHPLYDQAAVDAARMAGVRSVQEQTAVIVRAALELLESIEGNEPFTAEKMRAFRRVFGA